ncbi:MAG: thiol oxidoreductase, partial [Spirochaetia bacterium]|nr:thiol oxidoreductase [Spirochaetia bacterium]
MPRFPFSAAFLAPAAALVFLTANPSNDADVRLSGGRATVFDETLRAFSFSARGLSEDESQMFFQGSRLFNRDFVSGLGPFYNTRSCLGCHFMDGRAEPPRPGQAAISLVLKLSLPGKGLHGEPIPEPRYGNELSPLANDEFAEEGKVFVEYETISGKYGDGSSYALSKPKYRIQALGYGDPASNVLISPRIAPALVGLGLLEAVPEKTILAFAEEQTALGLRGRPNRVWDIRKNQFALGRFGWKANEPSIEQQVARALSGDLGITSTLFRKENATVQQRKIR